MVKVTYRLEMDEGMGWDNQIWVFKQLTTSTYKLEQMKGLR